MFINEFTTILDDLVHLLLLPELWSYLSYFYWWSYFSLLELSPKFKSKSHYDRRLVGQSALVSGTHLGPATNFSFSLRFPLDPLPFSQEPDTILSQFSPVSCVKSVVND
jgi:hypothetical protein